MNRFNEFEKAYCDIINENKVTEETTPVADKEGTYKNFTGTIDYEGNDAEVTDANFELNDGKIYWKDGIWKHGIWEDGIWENGIWKNGFWSFGEWRNGTWKDGTWEGGEWLGGEWYQGKIYDEHANGFMVEYNPPYSSAF